jgi:hypothetical protein
MTERTPDLPTLRSLLERVRAAKGPNVQLDNDICSALQDPAFVLHSIDAAVALVGRVLPGSDIGLDIEALSSGHAVAKIWTRDFGDESLHEFGWSGDKLMPSAPLAILAALLSALIAQAEADAVQLEMTDDDR